MPDNTGVTEDMEVEDVEDLQEAPGGLREAVGELRLELDAITTDNDEFMREHQLGVHPMGLLQTQLRVLVELICPDEEDRIGFDILVQKSMRREMESAVEEQKAAEMKARLTTGFSTGGVGGAANMPGMAGAVDLSAFKDAPRKVRREAARRAVKDAMKGERGEG